MKRSEKMLFLIKPDDFCRYVSSRTCTAAEQVVARSFKIRHYKDSLKQQSALLCSLVRPLNCIQFSNQAQRVFLHINDSTRLSEVAIYTSILSL